MGYPGLDLSEHGDEIPGFIFSSENFADHWARLDEFDGRAYERVLTVVKLADNGPVDAYIYALSGK